MHVKTLADALYFLTTKIETTSADGLSGTGTGFFFVYPQGDKSIPFIITNKHVVRGAETGVLNFLQGRDGSPILGHLYRQPIGGGFENIWHGHPSPEVDVCVTPLWPFIERARESHGVEVYWRHVGVSDIPSELEEDAVDAIESVLFIGYPNGIWDETNKIPVARRGSTATPYTVDYEGQPKFLIDASVFPGSSGSPVFLFNSGAFIGGTRKVHVGERIKLLGVVAATFILNQDHEIRERDIPTSRHQYVRHQEILDLGIVFKAPTIVIAIEEFLKEKEQHA